MTIKTVGSVEMIRLPHGTLYIPPEQAGRLSEDSVRRNFPIDPKTPGYNAAENESVLTPLGRAILAGLRRRLKGKVSSVHIGPWNLRINLLPGSGRRYSATKPRDEIQKVVKRFLKHKTKTVGKPVKRFRSAHSLPIP